MAKPPDDETDEKPLDPATERVRRRLVRFMAINLGILFAAVIIVIGAIVYRSVSTRTSQQAQATAPVGDAAVPNGETIEGDIALPVGSRIVSQSWSGNRLSLQVEGLNREQSLVVYDLAQRRVVARLKVTWE